MNFDRKTAEWAIHDPLFPRHMTFIVGPRQVGKTTLAKHTLKTEGLDINTHYYNWDRPEVRKKFKEGSLWLDDLKSTHRPTLVFDEIHKVRQWKRLLKGIYDHHQDDFKFIVTGSGRLDHFQRGGDSLAGRYDLAHLFPLVPSEIEPHHNSKMVFDSKFNFNLERLKSCTELKESTIADWETLGGFPEPFSLGSERKANTWWSSYQQRVTEEDLRDLTRLESVDLMRSILEILPHRVGSPLSIRSLALDTEVSFATAKRYLQTLQQLFLIFEVPPFSKKIHRAVKKEKKIYYYHHPAITNGGAKLENMVALILNRWVHQMNETGYGEWSLNYLRDQDRREIDFLLCHKQQPKLLVEVKTSDPNPTPALYYYQKKLGIPAVQVVRQRSVLRKVSDHLMAVSLHRFADFFGG